MQTAQQRITAEQKAKAFVKNVNEWCDAQKRVGIREPGWPVDTDMACEAFELAFSFGGVEDY